MQRSLLLTQSDRGGCPKRCGGGSKWCDDDANIHCTADLSPTTIVPWRVLVAIVCSTDLNFDARVSVRRPPNNDFPLSWSPEFPYFETPAPLEYTCASQGPFELRADQPMSLHSAWCAVNTPKESGVLPDQQIRDNCLVHLETAKNASVRSPLIQSISPISGFNGEIFHCRYQMCNSVCTSRSEKHRPKLFAQSNIVCALVLQMSKPFFVGCGFHKPHAPHEAPKEFFDLVPSWENTPLPADPFAPIGMPVVAWHPFVIPTCLSTVTVSVAC